MKPLPTAAALPCLSLNTFLIAWAPVLFAAVCLFPRPTAAQEAREGNDEADPDHDWLTYYYTNPEPEKLVSYLHMWSDARILNDQRARPALIGFLSQVFRQNRDKIKEWYGEVADFPPEDMQTLRLALIFSRTSEAEEILKAEEGDDYVERKVPKILEMSVEQLATFDMLWGFYYATGSEAVITRMVSLFRYRERDIPEGAEVPPGYVAMFKQLPDAAHWALVSNAETHPSVLKILEEKYRKGTVLDEIEKEGVYEVLSEVLPEKYPPAGAEEEEAGEPRENPVPATE